MKRNFFQRLLGIPATKLPINNDFWTIKEGTLIIDLEKIHIKKGSAVRIEGKDLGKKILLVFGEDGKYHLLHNECSHGKRCLDPVPDEVRVQCCSLGKRSFNYKGEMVSEGEKEDILAFPIISENGMLEVKID